MFMMAGIIAGILLSMQTAANARLRSYVGSPFASALISCTVSFLLVIMLLCVRTAGGGLTAPVFTGSVWWMYLGGVFGVGVLVGSIVLFPILGAVQTTVLPIFGQILLGILADAFGWFGGMIKPFSLRSLTGVIILIAGIVCVVVLPDRKTEKKDDSEIRQGRRWVWQVFGVLIGMASAAQAAVNGKLGSCLGSPLYASVSSIGTVVVLALLINIKQKTLNNIRSLSGTRAALWAVPGGIFGAAFILLNTTAVPVIGTGTLMVLSVAGQLFCSVLIQHFGWFYSQQKRILPVQFAGLLLVLAGVVIVRIG